MPYFDDRTYTIKEYVRDSRCVQSFAEEFYESCLSSGAYPAQILCAQERALKQNNQNEIVIMADATTKFAQSMEKAFDAELRRATTRESRYDLLCITMAALYTYRFGDIRYGNPLLPKAHQEKEKYDAEYGPDDLAFLQSFIEERIREIRRIAAAEEEERIACQREEEERLRKEEAIKAEQEKQRQAERAAEISRKRAEQKALQKIRSDAWQAKVEAFKQLPLTDQLRTVVSGREIPAAYDTDFGAITASDLKAVPGKILVQVITSFLNVKDAGWKELQEKAKKILSDSTDTQ